jgi:hypothetical protein
VSCRVLVLYCQNHFLFIRLKDPRRWQCEQTYCSALPYSAALSAIVAPLPRCLRHSANTATARPRLTPRCRCRLRAACFHRATAVLLLPTLPLCYQRCHRAANAAAMLPPPTPHCRRLLPHCLPPLSCHRCRHRHRHQCAAAASLVLPTPSSCCPPLPRRCCAANAVTALPLLTPRCRCHCHAAHCCRAAAAPGVAHDVWNKCVSSERAVDRFSRISWKVESR